MTRAPSRARPAPRRGSVIVVVLWTIAIGTLAAAATQLLAYRQATVGRLSVERVQARWAARAGIEHSISVMANHTEFPEPDDAFAMTVDLEQVSQGGLGGATYSILRAEEGVEWKGPADEHARLNINHDRVSAGLLLLLFDDLTLDVADAITDWRDDDDDPGTLGVEREYYESLHPPYRPRNANLRSIAELELVAGVFPEDLRGEDWNLNGRLDPNENDVGRTLPYDNADGLLDAGWSEFLTAYSIAGGPTASGLPRLYLRRAEPEDLVARLGVSDAQARSLIYYGRNENNTLEGLATVPLAQVDDQGNVSQTMIVNPPAAPLDDLQLRACLDELTITDPLQRKPGKMNVNSVTPRLLRRLIEALGADDFIADEILYRRESASGVSSVLDLRDIPELPPALWDQLAQLFTTRSAIFSINSRGSSRASGVEVEINMVVDRSTVPIRILEYREQ
jgi:hypothetical protein